MNVKSFAKINVSLRVLGKREDGYHDLEMVNLPIDLHDVILINMVKGLPDTYVTCDDIRLMSLRVNLCTKAVDAMRAMFHFKENFVIHIHKEIPFAAGLGGGSSNAAAVMLGINKMLKLNATPEQLHAVAMTLGSDVPFFLDPKPMKVTGRGEIMEPISVSGDFYCLVVKPEQGLSTKDVFAICDDYPQTGADTELVMEGLAEGDLAKVAKGADNDLLLPSSSICPEIKKLVEMMRADGLDVANMTGSGSSCYGLTKDKKLAKRLESKYADLGYLARICKVMK